tara:strand:- start:41 stop:385 length:345 start_codon:yes stop_codon:yes gene_type:complete
MSCGLHTNLDAAVAAVKKALTSALDADIAEKDLEDILAAYTNLKSVAGRQPSTFSTGTGITFVPDSTLGDSLEFNDNINIDTNLAAETVTFGTDYLGGAGQDVISFGDDIHNDV